MRPTTITVVEHHQHLSWCGLFLTMGVGVGLAVVAHHLWQGSARAMIETTEAHDDGWTTHVIRVGHWSDEAGGFVGPIRYELELIAPDGELHRVKTNIRDPKRAEERMAEKLAELRELP